MEAEQPIKKSAYSRQKNCIKRYQQKRPEAFKRAVKKHRENNRDYYNKKRMEFYYKYKPYNDMARELRSIEV